MEKQNNLDCRAIVMEYLLHYCYKQSAKALLNDFYNLDQLETNTKSSCLLNENNIKWNIVDARKDILQAIREGDIEKAFNLIEHHFPILMKAKYQSNNNGPHYILYKLRCQQFIEVLRNFGVIAAFEFAREYLEPYNKLYNELTCGVTFLIAYEDLENDNIKDMLSQNERDTIADLVNKMILESQQFSSQTTLEKIWRQKTTVQVELNNQLRRELSTDKKENETTEKVSL